MTIQFIDDLCDDILELIFGFRERKPINELFEGMGYDTTNFIKSLGSEFFSIISMLLILIFSTIIVKLALKYH